MWQLISELYGPDGHLFSDDDEETMHRSLAIYTTEEDVNDQCEALNNLYPMARTDTIEADEAGLGRWLAERDRVGSTSVAPQTVEAVRDALVRCRAEDAIAGRLDAFLESCAYVRWVPHHRVDAALASGWRRPAGPPVLSRHSFHALLLEWDGEAGEEVPDIVGAEP